MTPSVPDFLAPDALTLDVRAQSATEAISEVAARLAHRHAMTCFEDFCGAVLDREKINPTSLGHGVVLPHARTDCVRQIMIAAGRSREGIWFENAKQTVHLIFVIGTPTDSVREYLALVGTITRLLRNAGVRDQLLRAETAEEFLMPFRKGA
jgi:mannitol/fructose-specific phosphotransferase system IIA component (Ntr-type)